MGPGRRFVVYGAGAVGGVIGARLHLHGHEVLLVARGANYKAIRDHGLRLESASSEDVVPVPVVEHPAEITFRSDDVVLLAMKTQHTTEAITALANSAPRTVSIACAQNGLENERLALRHFTNVYGIAVMCPTLHLEPGVVQAYSDPVAGIIDIGRWPDGVDDTAVEIARVFESAGFVSVPRADIARWKARKLVMNLANAVQALCAEGGGEIVKRAQAEGEEVLRAAGIDFVSEADDLERRGDLLRWKPINGAQRPGGSSWQSLARGTGSIETDYLNGEIVLLGRLHGVATPTNALLQELAGAAARSGSVPGGFTEAALLSLLS